MDTQTIAERIRAKTRSLHNGCIEWTGAKDPKGFGRLHVGSRTDGTRRMALAHRWVYALANGLDTVPRDVQIVQLCDNRACVSAAHLSPLIRRKKGRAVPAATPLSERFWAKTRIAADCDCRLCCTTSDPAAKCIIWTAAEKGNGYGAFWDGARTRRAHRFSYELVVGPVPEGLELDHLCRIHSCVAPAHLEAVTQAENRRRGLLGDLAPLRLPSPLRTLAHCRRDHELTPENSYWESPSKSHPRGRRRCLACRRAIERGRVPSRAKAA